MKLKLFIIGILVTLSMFMFGCNRSNNTLNEVKKTENQEIEEKLSKASYSSELDPIQRTMEESVEYVKGILPQGVEEVDRNYESEVGVTEVTYKVDNLEFKVRYMHPYKENGNSDEYDLNKTAGIDLALK